MDLILDFEDFEELIDGDLQFKYIINYLTNLGATVFILEDGYIDKDFMIDFSKYHSRSFGQKRSETKRCHFFQGLDERGLHALFESDGEAIQDHYLGFIVLKPTGLPFIDPVYDRVVSLDEPERYTIGRTVLRTYDEVGDDQHLREYIRYPNECNLFGVPLKVESLPFQGKDYIVGMCATSALWTTMCCLSHYYDAQHPSMYEITKESVSLVAPTIRSFPNDGLSIEQTVHFLNSKGLVVECFSIQDDDADLVQELIRAYIPANIPLIATLKYNDRGPEGDTHAVVVSGYSLNGDGGIGRLYLHDDNVCPYARIMSDDGFLTWRYQDRESPEGLRVNFITIPLYHKIRAPFQHMRDYRNLVQRMYNHGRDRALEFNLSLTTVNEYKNELRNRSFCSKESILIKQFPRYLWVVRGYRDQGDAVVDWLYDATSPRGSPMGFIEYEDVGEWDVA